MLTFAYPWLFVLLPLPWLVAKWWPEHREPRPALHVPFLKRLVDATGRQPGNGAAVLQGVRGRRLVVAFTWLCAVAALARPQWIEPPVSRTLPMRDLVLAVDLSGSMQTRDFTDRSGKPCDRLSAVKEVLDEFLSHRQGDRVALVFFGTAPFVQAPFTEDLGVCRRLLDEAQVNLAGQQTAFGDAIGLSINLFDRSTMKEKVLIALTDGNDTSSRVPPPEAARIAKDKGIVIHTVAVGDPRAAGEDALDISTLRTVASTTGGLYSAANDRRQLETIYRQLDRMEARQERTVSLRPKRDIYHWPLATALVASMAFHGVLLLLRAFRRESNEVAVPAGKERAA